MNQQTNSARRNNQTNKPTAPVYTSAPPMISRMNNSGMSGSSGSSGSSGGYSGSKVIGIVIVVVVLVLLIGACYWLYTIYSNRVFQTTVETEVMPDVKDAASNFSIGSGSIPSSNYSNEYSVSMWLNIDNYTYKYGQEKIILRRGDKGSGNPEILLDAKTNDLIVRVKLQNGGGSVAANPLVISSSSVSSFADIPKLALQTHQTEVNEPSDNAYIHGRFPGGGDQTASNTLNRVGSNVVDYHTIQYQQATECDNALTTMQPTEAMTIMIEQAARMKEKEAFTAGGDYDLARVDTSRLSDNSAPLESRHVYHDEYFTQISGNEVSPTRVVAALKEGFDAAGDLTNACVAVMVDMCKFASAMQSQTNADNQVAAMNTAFQTVIDALEAGRSNAKTADDITAAFNASMSNIAVMMVPSGTFTPLIANLQRDLDALEAASLQPGASSIGFSTIQSAVNTKLSSMNCPLTLSGNNEVDITTNFYAAFISMVKKSLYAYINNMGAGLQQSMPELAGAQSASCLIQNITNPDPTVGTCVVRAIPLQKWVHVIVSVYNQVVDIFIDGQLASSCVLKGFPAISTSNVLITPDGGFAGKISRVKFSNTAMTVQHAKKLYYDGPVATSGLLDMIPNWVWYGVIFIIILGIGYSVLM
jgi:hypothetical protein